ncbi:MAG TPA: thioredoxin domain-containing protein [Bdellovibrionota bacterium]|jgi:protein-disulfide isomerase
MSKSAFLFTLLLSLNARADSGTVAVFEGKPITSTDLDRESPAIYRARLALYKAQKAALDESLRRRVLESQAKKQNITVDALLAKEIQAAKSSVSDAEVEKYLAKKNSDSSRVSAETRDKVRALVHLQKLVAKADVKVTLARPKAPVLELKTEGEPSWGGKAAPITIVEFADFQCSYCVAAKKRMGELKEKYGDKIKFVFKNFPLPVHAQARDAAEAGMCVHAQGNEKFWKFHEQIFENQKTWTKEDFKSFAQNAGVDMKAFESCYDGKKFAAKVDASIAEGSRLGIDATPSFLVNGLLFKGTPTIAELSEILEE